jgi:molybdopterin/thiamine biosynthesis adenylyltransferase
MNALLEIPGPSWADLRADLLSTPELERAAVGFAGLNGERLLVRDWQPLAPEDYLVQLGHHLEVAPQLWARAAKRSRRSGEAIVIFHSHPRDQKRPRFSSSDDGGEALLIPKLQARASVPVAAAVISPGGYAARLTEPGRSTVPLDLHHPGAWSAARQPRGASATERFDRQLRALGDRGQDALSSLRVGVVGAGGLGSHLIQQLLHLGVGEILVVDHDRLATSNLSRVVGAGRRDALLHRHKTRVMRRLARRIGGPTNLIELPASVTDEAPARALLGCDVVFGATDNHWSRTVLNALAFQYYLPVVDLGVEVQPGGATGGRVAWLSPGGACLWCMGILDPERVRVEQLPAATAAAERERGYIAGLEEPAPAVVSINGVIASLALTEVLARLTGFAGDRHRPDLLLYRLAAGDVRRSSPEPRPDCPTCSASGTLGAGDLASAPWTIAPPAPGRGFSWHRHLFGRRSARPT